MQSKANVKVTVIVPVHNSEKYLQQCLESVSLQTLRDIEVLCVDSSNTSRCFQIIAGMKAKDNRIVYIEDLDTSYGHKINVGIGLAKGDYVAVLETDDQMLPDMLEELYSAGELYHVDIVNSNFLRFVEYKGRKITEKGNVYAKFLVYDSSMNYISKTSLPTIFDGSDRKFSVKFSKFSTTCKNSTEFYPVPTFGLWTALYRRSFLLAHDICLNESPGASYQDSSFLFLTGLLAKSVYHLDEAFYLYRKDNIDSSVKDGRKVFEIADEFRFLKLELEKRNITDAGAWNLFYFRKYEAFYLNYHHLSEKNRELFFKRHIEELREDTAIGAVSREMCDEQLYQWTFLLMDNPEKFMEIVKEANTPTFLETMTEILDRLEGRDIVVFGAGIRGTKVVSILQQNKNRIFGICDNAEHLHGTTLAGLKIAPVTETVKCFPNACYLIANYMHSDEMKAQLLAEGIPEENIEIFK